MKKKREEGYALVFVLVVMIVLCTVALSLMGIALRNLQTQVTSIERMQDKYVAQGDIEVIVSRLEAATEIPVGEIANFISTATEIGVNDIEVSNSGEGDSITAFTAKFDLVSNENSTLIKCQVVWEVTLTKKDDVTYKIKTSKLNYNSYQISTVSEGGDGA